ncbi:MAG: hypothetical protein ACFFCO_13110 [Promethearchaeota archaeon]
MNPSSGTEDPEPTEPPTPIDRLTLTPIYTFFVLDQVFIDALFIITRPSLLWIAALALIGSLVVFFVVTARTQGKFLAAVAGWQVLSHLYYALILFAIDLPIMWTPTLLVPLVASIALGQILLILAAAHARARP